MAEGGMHWERSPEALIERFGTVMEGFPEAERRKMFGYPAAFLNGHMFTGLHGPRWVVRLPEDVRAGLLAQGASPFEPMPGRPMRDYVVLPESIVDDTAALRPWIEQALAFVAALPPKDAKPAKSGRKR